MLAQTDDVGAENLPSGDLVAEAEEWRTRLLARLQNKLPLNRERIAWYLGQQPVPEVPAKYRSAYRLLLDMSRNAWARLVTEAISERATVTGVRLAGDDTDLEIWRLLKRNHLDIDQRLVHTEALAIDTSYYSVWPDERLGASIVPESGLQVIHESDPADRRRVVAAIKCWRDDLAKQIFATLYLEDSIWYWQAPYPDTWATSLPHDPLEVGEQDLTTSQDPMPPGAGSVQKLSDLEWQERRPPVANPLGTVPMVPFVNRPTLFAGPQSEIDDLIPVFRRIDKTTLDMLLTSETAAFLQKWATGLKIPADKDGNPIEPYDAAVTKLWVSPSKDVTFGQFQASPLDPYLKVIDSAVAQVSAISRVPSYYLVSPNLVNPPSAESMEATESGLIHKVESWVGVLGESYEILTRLALRAARDDRANEDGLEMVWKDPSMPSASVLADAATKWATLGVPNEVLWERAGASPEDIARWRTIAAREALSAQVLAPTTVQEAEEAGETQEQAEEAEEVNETEPDGSE